MPYREKNIKIRLSKFLSISIPIISVLVLGLLFGYPVISLISVSKYPAWVKDKVFRESILPKSDPPASVTHCYYKNQSVYYVPPRCCDIPGGVYDESGTVICSPDSLNQAGISSCPDFFSERRKCSDIWKDIR